MLSMFVFFRVFLGDESLDVFVCSLEWIMELFCWSKLRPYCWLYWNGKIGETQLSVSIMLVLGVKNN